MMSWYGGAGNWGMSLMVAVWVAVFALTAWLIARATRTEHSPLPVETPRALLDRRFAAGELSAQEYAAMRRALERPIQPVE